MADTPKSPDAPGGRRRKREPATIDLTATEVPPATSAGASPNAAESPPEPEPRPAGTKPAGFGIRPHVANVVAGLVGAAVAMLAIFAASSAGLLLVPSDVAREQHTEIVALQKQVRDLQGQPLAGAQPMDALRARLGKVEQDIANLPPGDKATGEQLAAADNAMKSLGIALTALNRRNDDTAATAKQALDRADATEKTVKDLQAIVQRAPAAAPPGELEELQKHVAALEQAAKATREDIVGGAAADQMARLALIAVALRSAVESGAPFAAELAEAKSLGADEAGLAPLARFAASGVPAKGTLARELGELMPALLKAANAAATPSGFLDRLQANAATLVRVRPVDAPPGDEPATVLARLEGDAAKADIDAALANVGKLPEAAQKLAQNWIEQAKARQAAISAARRLAASTTQALGR